MTMKLYYFSCSLWVVYGVLFLTTDIPMPRHAVGIALIWLGLWSAYVIHSREKIRAHFINGIRKFQADFPSMLAGKYERKD